MLSAGSIASKSGCSLDEPHGDASRAADVVADHLQIAGPPDLAQRQPDLQRPEPARVLRAEVEVVHRPRRRSGSSGGWYENALRSSAASRTSAQPASSGAYSHLCGSTATESASRERRAGSRGAPGTRAASAPYAPSTWNQTSVLAADGAISGSGSTAPVLTDPGRADDQERLVAAARGPPRSAVGAPTVSIRCRSSVGIQSNRVGPEAEQIRGLLDPGVRFGRGVDAAARRHRDRQPFLPHVPAGLGGARGDEADEVRHVAAADQQAAGTRPESRSAPRSSGPSALRSRSPAAPAARRRRSG